ncbi:hypothetical protein BOX15_Mlig019869g2 [Macrostomum lignano]|uniref:ANK_REP_REGION domain-containing protein n=1 Tax=Macrostomum lignano TaxID=282301 RepID=A0A267E1G0_9PLAT|nr:hypothetical protein BOX15_Mlig019869g2 [Macrostomum lignano]
MTTDVQTVAQLVIQGDFDQVQRLETRQLVTTTDQANRTVLMLAADSPRIPAQAEKCILYLIKLGADTKAIDESGNTAAHLAARQDNVRLLALMPFNAKWLQNSQGLTPLMEAAQTGSWSCAKHLLHLLRQWSHIEWTETDKKEAGSSDLPKQNGGGKGPEKPKNERKRLLGLKDLNVLTAVDIATRNGHEELAGYIEREMRLVVTIGGLISGLTPKELSVREELQRFAEAGDFRRLQRMATRDNCDLPDKWGRTAAMWAAGNSKCNDEELWKQLLQLADPTCAYVGADNSLHYAARSGNSVAASALLDAGALTNARDHSSYTPLMLAAKYAPAATAASVGRVLLDAGSDWSLKDRDGKTALELAVEKGKSELAELLRRYEGRSYF